MAGPLLALSMARLCIFTEQTTLPPTTNRGGRASHCTINGATMRLCGADHPASRHPIAAALSAELRVPLVPSLSRGACRGRSRSLRVPPHRAYSSKRRTAIFAVVAGGSRIMRVNPDGGNGKGLRGRIVTPCPAHGETRRGKGRRRETGSPGEE